MDQLQSNQRDKVRTLAPIDCDCYASSCPFQLHARPAFLSGLRIRLHIGLA